jgi:hypothetical protein
MGASESSGTGPGEGTTPAPELDALWARLDAELRELEVRLEGDATPRTASRALHRLIAVTSVANRGLAMGSRAAPAPPAPSTLLPGSIGAPSDAAATLPLTSPPLAGERFEGELTARLETLAGTLQRIVALIARRTGARGYSIGVSVPAGISLTIEFGVPPSPTPSPP